MKKFLVFFVCISSGLFAQDFDKEYLESLPPDVIEQLEIRAYEKEDTVKPKYRKSTQININKQVKRFGDDFFNTVQSTFMPINEPNLSNDYVVDFGDVIDVQLIGQKSKIISLQIKRDGSISLPEIGKINISGLTMKRVDELIKIKVKNAFIGTEAFTTLSSIKDIQILVAGDAYQPGVYTVNGNTTLLQGLVIAGGVSDYGSYREIHLKRDGEVIHTLDLYDILISGDTSADKSLRSGDVIFVTPIKNLVSSQGAFKRPNTYELKKTESLNTLLKFSSGIDSYANKDRVILTRIEKGIFKQDEINLNNLDYRPKSGDIFYIDKYKISEVEVNGEVLYPGRYFINEKSTLSSVIKRAGGYLETADESAGRLFNNRAKIIEKEARQRTINDLISFMSSSDNESISNINFYVYQFEQVESKGRLITEFDIQKIESNPSLDRLLQDGDIIEIPKISNEVFVYGEVNNQGSQKYSDTNSMFDYIKLSGGLTKFALENSIYVVMPNGEVYTSNSGRWGFNSQKNIPPGSVIFIPRDIGKVEGISRWALITPIIGNLALSVASLAAIESN